MVLNYANSKFWNKLKFLDTTPFRYKNLQTQNTFDSIIFHILTATIINMAVFSETPNSLIDIHRRFREYSWLHLQGQYHYNPDDRSSKLLRNINNETIMRSVIIAGNAGTRSAPRRGVASMCRGHERRCQKERDQERGGTAWKSHPLRVAATLQTPSVSKEFRQKQ